MLMSSKSVSDLDGCVAIFWLCWLGIDKIMGYWIFVVDELLYRKSLLLDSDSGKRSVGMDVLCVVSFWFFRTVWVRFLVLDDCLAIGGVVRVVLHLE